MHSSSVLAVLAAIGSAQAAYAAPAVSSQQDAATIPVYSVSSEQDAATIPAYATTSASSEEAAATIPVYSVSSEEASASAPVYPYYSSANAAFNLTTYATRFLNASAIATTTCTESTVPSSAVVVIPTSTVVVSPSSSGVVPIQTEETDATITVYPSVQTQEASANAPTTTISLTVTSTIQLCSAAYSTVTVTETDTVTVTSQSSVPAAVPTEEAATEEESAYVTTTKVLDVTVTAPYPIQTEEASASFSTLHQMSTKTSTYYVQPLSTNPALTYQNASTSLSGSRPAYSGPTYEGGAARYSVAGFTMVAMVLATVL